MELSKNKIEKWLPHFSGLLLFIILPLFVFDRNNERAIYWIYSYYYQLAFMIVAFYVNYLLIVPRFFYAKKRLRFFVVLFLFAISLLVTSQLLYNVLQLDLLRPSFPMERTVKPMIRFGLHPKIIDNFLLLLIVLGFSSGMAIVQQLRKNETKQKEIDKARVDTELAFLKNQISPHFFFNSLNNIYALIALDADKAQKAVEKLSVLMRYLIYDSDVKTVDIQKEFAFTKSYIDLMEQRLTAKVKLETDIQEELPQAEIPPLIFIPFVENAFKHGVSYREQSYISIVLQANSKQLVFACRNRVQQLSKTTEKKGGIGIANIRKRLELIYGDEAQLIITDDGQEYQVHLTLPIAQKS